MQPVYATVPLSDLCRTWPSWIFFLLNSFNFSLFFLFVTYFSCRVWGCIFIYGTFKSEAILNMSTEVRRGVFWFLFCFFLGHLGKMFHLTFQQLTVGDYFDNCFL